MQESYYNITHQTLAIWSTLSADPATTHVMKVDDDSYVRAPLLQRYLKNMARKALNELFIGYIEPVSGPIRDERSKWQGPSIISQY